MNTQITKGKWEATILPGGVQNTKLVSVEPSICGCTVKLSNPKEAEANAKLIASAPGLLQACGEALELIDYLYKDDKDNSDVMNNLKKVIKEATGKEYILST